jgi:hypothetical protein
MINIKHLQYELTLAAAGNRSGPTFLNSVGVWLKCRLALPISIAWPDHQINLVADHPGTRGREPAANNLLHHLFRATVAIYGVEILPQTIDCVWQSQFTTL